MPAYAIGDVQSPFSYFTREKGSSNSERHGQTYGPHEYWLPNLSTKENKEKEHEYPDRMRYELLKGYCAGVTFMDSQLGKVIYRKGRGEGVTPYAFHFFHKSHIYIASSHAAFFLFCIFNLFIKKKKKLLKKGSGYFKKHWFRRFNRRRIFQRSRFCNGRERSMGQKKSV
jgi:hypothetical protein